VDSIPQRSGVQRQNRFYDLKVIAKTHRGEIIFVTTGTGSVDLVVCQLCPAWGLRVIAWAWAGSDAKSRYLR